MSSRSAARSNDVAHMLKVTGVSKSYPTPRGELPILTDVSLSLDRGGAIAIMGPSGSGKSTLLYILGALERPTSGTVTLDGQDPFALGERDQAAFRNRHVGFVFQDHSLLPQCSVLENVLAPTLVAPPDAVASGGGRPESVASGFSRTGRRQTQDNIARARTILGQVGLSKRLDHFPGELSGGEKQRAALARALIRNPALLLCDEPTGNLDRTSADAVAQLLLDLHAARETILIVVTHNLALAEKFPVRYEMVDRGLKPEA